jgi:hypothetical protein
MGAEVEPRLTIELVPQSCWFSNVRDQVSPSDWDRIRKQVYEAANRRCEVCGGRGPRHPVECHEVWEYDEAAGVQRLTRMTALCPACHEVKHIGLAGIRGRADIARAHLAEVNGWSAETAEQYVEEAFATWQARSTRAWSLDISGLVAYGIDPALISKTGRTAASDRSRSVASVVEEKARRPQNPG